ncbi:HNH endonuclease [Mycoplasmopsis mustelae]|uniref:HNH endonuclease n=1 Tax=Mycoplasmopsis mustelae TaxID=171289 RepID=UPI0014170576|nr:HNH endonuclease [Mycoplasmopsis mustelae]
MTINWKHPYHSTKWKKLRDQHLNKFPYCIQCFNTLNLHVDHIIEHRNNEAFFLDACNLQTLCARCHGAKSKQFQKLKSCEIKDVRVYLVFNTANGLNLDDVYWLNKQIHQYINQGDSFVFYIANENLNYQRANNLIEFLFRFFIALNFVSFNIVLNIETKFDIVENIKKRMQLT